MGLPIDPGDPRNGGCSTCVGYLPFYLHMTFTWEHGDVYQGFLRQDPVESHLWHGELSDGVHVPRHAGCHFCYSGIGNALVSFYGAWPYLLVNAHCNLPFAGENQDGFDFIITPEQPF